MSSGFFTDALSSAASAGVSSAVASAFGGSSAREARRARKFAYEFDANKHHRNVADLRQAGLNPILSATTGANPASSPPNIQAKADTPADKIKAASTARQVHAQIENIKKDTQLKEQQIAKTAGETAKIAAEKINIEADTQLKRVLKPKTLAEIQKIRQDALKSEAETFQSYATQREIAQRIELLKTKVGLNDQQLKEMLTRFPGLLVEQKIDESTYGEMLRWMDRALPAINSASGALGAIGIFKNFKSLKRNKDWGAFDKKTGVIYD